jgi:superfamily II DNA or RNA helicase
MTIHNFERDTDAQSLKRGKKYYEDNRVTTINKVDGGWKAVVDGSELYEVDIYMKGNDVVNYRCSCPVGGLCKHTIATLFEIRVEMTGTDRSAQPHEPKPTPQTTPAENVGLNKKPFPTSASELYEAYQELPAPDKLSMQLMALVGEPFTTSEFSSICTHANLKYGGQQIIGQLSKQLLKAYEQKGFIDAVQGTKWQMKMAFADRILDKDFDRNFLPLVTAVQRGTMIGFWGNGQFDMAQRYFREARLARYTNNVNDFKTNFYRAAGSGRSYSLDFLFNYFLGKTFDEQRLEKIPLSIRVIILTEYMNQAYLHLEKADAYFDYAIRLLPHINEEEERAFLAKLLAQIVFLKGDWRGVEAFGNYHSAFLVSAFGSINLLLRGDVNDSLTGFDLALKALRKITRNPKEFMPNIFGVFQILAQLKTNDASYYGKIQEHVKKATKNTAPITNQPFEYLDCVILALQNDKISARNYLTRTLPIVPLNRFIYFFCEYWVDEGLIDKGRLKAFYDELVENGYAWLAEEILHLLARVEPHRTEWKDKLAAIQTPLSIQPILDFVQKVEEWESALNMLIGMNKIAKPTNTAKENDSRIIWLIDFEHRQIQPKEQTFGKTGWTSGRNIALSRLKQGDVKNLTDQDRRVIRQGIVGYSSGWGGAQYDMDYEKALPELVGHEYLFLMNSPSVAVQLMDEKPSLTAKQTSNGFVLQMSHDINPLQGAGYSVVKESPTRYKLIKITEDILRIARAMNGKNLVIPAKGKEQLERALQALSGTVTVQSAFDAESQNLPSVEADARPCVHLLPVGDGFHVELFSKPFGEDPPYFKPAKGEPTVIGSVNGQRVQTKRDLKLEKKNTDDLVKNLAVLKDIKANHGVYELENADNCLQFLYELQPKIDDQSIILEWPKGEKFRISKVAGFGQFKLKINAQNDWFEVDGQLRVDENTVLGMKELLKLSEQKGGQFVELSPGRFLALTNEFRKRLQEINGLMSETKDGRLQLHPLATTAMQEFTDAVSKENFEFDKKYKQSIDRLKRAFNTNYHVSENLNAELRPYQKEGFEWLSRLAKWGVGAVLADDMGLGKTVQALTLLLDRGEDGPTLVVAPASVCRNWMKEIEKFTPTLRGLLFGEGDRAAMIEEAKTNDILVTTYDLMTREAEQFTKKKWTTIILDEAQAIKNRSTKRSETAMQLQGEFKIVMSGTPLENHLGELWNLFQFANPGLLGSADKFQERFATPIERYNDKSRRHQLKRLVQPFILRRRKDEVLKELPAKTEIQLTVELTPEERGFYEALRRRALEKLQNTEGVGGGEKHLQILAEIMRLRRAACHPRLVDENANFIESSKLRLFGETVEELIENGHKALVFSQFVGHLAILEKYLKEKNISYQYLDGSTPLKKRQERIEAFQAGEGDLFLISLKAGGTGLNLTAADYVIHMDPWWNPAVEDQATDRAHRIGQSKPVTVYRLVTEGTIEEKILKLHESKRDLADSLLEGTDGGTKLSADELMELLKAR